VVVKMPSVSISVSDELKKRLKKNDLVNWSAVARKAFEEELSKIELMDRLTKNVKATDKDIEELSKKIKRAMAKRLDELK
jgi:post-segregation antitoxin (ccd killing protein)